MFKRFINYIFLGAMVATSITPINGQGSWQDWSKRQSFDIVKKGQEFGSKAWQFAKEHRAKIVFATVMALITAGVLGQRYKSKKDQVAAAQKIATKYVNAERLVLRGGTLSDQYKEMAINFGNTKSLEVIEEMIQDVLRNLGKSADDIISQGQFLAALKIAKLLRPTEN